MTNSFENLIAHARETQVLAGIAGRLGWDQETVMPPGSAPLRAEESAAMEALLHRRRTDPHIGDWLAAIDGSTLNEPGRAQLREIRRSFERNTKVPERLATEIARITSRAQGIWAQARAAESFDDFSPVLDQVLNLRREEAAALAQGADAYDALLQDYEPGTTGAELAAMFDAMRPRLVALTKAIADKGGDTPELTGHFDESVQMALSHEIATIFGYDFDKGRIDKAVHPFSSGSGLDVRITTRTDPTEPFGCIYSTIHEVGHATYEQNVDPAYRLTTIGNGASMGVHESQSRIYENQLGRSRAFCEFLFGKMRDRFGDIGVSSAEAFYAAVNRVAPGFIRTEADEVHYNLHIMLRFDLERALIGGGFRLPTFLPRGMTVSPPISDRWSTSPPTVSFRMFTGPSACSGTSRPIRSAMSMRAACTSRLPARSRIWTPSYPMEIYQNPSIGYATTFNNTVRFECRVRRLFMRPVKRRMSNRFCPIWSASSATFTASNSAPFPIAHSFIFANGGWRAKLRPIVGSI